MFYEGAGRTGSTQWLTEAQSQNLPKEKLADTFTYLIRLADKLAYWKTPDLLKAADNKIKLNEIKYPADTVRGSAKKYTEY